MSVGSVPDVSKLIRRVRQRLAVSQETLSRQLDATKGAIQHWERGRNKPDLRRLYALRQLCPPGAERKELDTLLKRSKAKAEHTAAKETAAVNAPRSHDGTMGSLPELRKENIRLQRQVGKLQATILRREEQKQTLEDLVAKLQRQIADLRSDKLPSSGEASSSSARSNA